MKNNGSWLCVLAATVSLPVYADLQYADYRLGQYNKAYAPLMAQAAKDPVADYYLGKVFLYGYGQLKNNHAALHFFHQAAKKGYLPAINFLARYELTVKQNPQGAFSWFKNAADKGDIEAQLYVCAAYLYGYGVSKNPGLSEKYYINAAKSGSALAQYFLGHEFINSRNSMNKKLGLIWLNKAANAGNPKAQTYLGEIYMKGKLAKKDLQLSESWLKKAATANYVPAMVKLGDLAAMQNENQQALDWYKQAINHKSTAAQLHLGRFYLDNKNPMANPQEGFNAMLKAAQADSVAAQRAVADLYKKGTGVAFSEELSAQWSKKAEETEKQLEKTPPLVLLSRWLTEDGHENLTGTPYALTGILTQWQNVHAVQNNRYNQSPQLHRFSKDELFKPQFILAEPNSVPMNDYYDALVKAETVSNDSEWIYPHYPYNHYIEGVMAANSPVLMHHEDSLPYRDEYYLGNIDNQPVDLMDWFNADWLVQANYMSIFDYLYFKALLGDAEAQFDLGQMFQHGVGIPQNTGQAITYYEQAASQGDTRAEYNLGVLYVTDIKHPENFKRGMDWLTDVAFKGNPYAQYVLYKIFTQGVKGQEANPAYHADPAQGRSMLYLSASNGYGNAQFELAELLAHGQGSDLNVTVQMQKDKLIRELYTGASRKGIAQAYVPLAFYNAMSTKPELQKQAFIVAKQQAKDGNTKAALLLGMLYDRGIGTKTNPTKALYWYQQAGSNAVSNFIMGTYLSEGKGLSQDKTKGLDLLKQASSAQFSYADLNLAVMEQQENQPFLPDLQHAYQLGNNRAGILLADYYLANGDDQGKLNAALEIYQGLAEKGDQYAELKLGYMLQNGLGEESNQTMAQKWYAASAEQGNPYAQYQLAQLFTEGATADPDYASAINWYQKAANALPEANVALGFVYETVENNYELAKQYYSLAAEKNNDLGLVNLGLIYEYGKGFPVDYKKSLDYYAKASEKQNAVAMTQMAGLYFYGMGMDSKNDDQALHWYKAAAELGNDAALYQLGLMSETGVATKLDFTNAVDYYRKSADLGNEKAMLALARMYRFGIGVDKDPAEALKFYQNLAERNNAYAQYWLGSYYLDATQGMPSAEKGIQLLKQARENGSPQAKKHLQMLEAQTKEKVSFIEPVNMNQLAAFKESSPDRIYMQALYTFDNGDEMHSKMILQRLVNQFPNYVPAKKIYQQLNAISSAINPGFGMV